MLQSTHEIILASESPRRKQLLDEAGFRFVVFPIKVSEKLKKNLNLEAQIMELAERKSLVAENELKLLKRKDYLLITADTMVTLEGEALGKPENKKEAEHMLTRLSGRSHCVKTAICVFASSSNQRICEIQSTDVFFRPIMRQEILDYIATGEPMDKAGAYAIQGEGKKFVEKYIGPYDNVVGLPVDLLKKVLQGFNYGI